VRAALCKTHAQARSCPEPARTQEGLSQGGSRRHIDNACLVPREGAARRGIIGDRINAGVTSLCTGRVMVARSNPPILWESTRLAHLDHMLVPSREAPKACRPVISTCYEGVAGVARSGHCTSVAWQGAQACGWGQRPSGADTEQRNRRVL